jgi:SAM-dependent methyltransferase
MSFFYEHRGVCPCCEKTVLFRAEHEWFRDSLLCPACGSITRERAVSLVMNEIFPTVGGLSIHESSPAGREFSSRLAREAHAYIGSHYFPHEPLGTLVKGFINQDLENQTFQDESFDIVLTLDVMEHVFHPGKAYSEIYRTLRPGGVYLHTFPILKSLTQAFVPRATLNADGSVTHLVPEPAYHGNPIDEKGALVTFDYGYDISRQIAEWAPFDVRIMRFWDHTHGVLGEYTEVVVCKKSP